MSWQVRRILRSDAGQALAEVNLILALVALGVFVVLGVVGRELAGLYQNFLDTWNAAGP